MGVDLTDPAILAAITAAVPNAIPGAFCVVCFVVYVLCFACWFVRGLRRACSSFLTSLSLSLSYLSPNNNIKKQQPKNNEQIDVIEYHVMEAAKLSFGELNNGKTLTTLLGGGVDALNVTTSGKGGSKAVTVNGAMSSANVVKAGANIKCGGAILQSIDYVLFGRPVPL